MMLSFYRETSRTALGGNDMRPGSHMREGASRNSYSSSGESDAAFRERIAFRVFGSILFFMFVLPLILAGIAVKFG
jgi:hypothetical protein